MGGWTRSEGVLAALVILAASAQRPMTFWASNAWDLMEPQKPLLLGLVLAVAAAALYWLFDRLTGWGLSLALGIALLIVLLTNWDFVSRTSAMALALATVALVMLSVRVRSRLTRGITLILILLFGLAPALQVVWSHLERAPGIPIVQTPPPDPASRTGLVEDVLVVIVDSYPSLSVAETLFGHDPSVVASGLSELGFVVPDFAWSQHTFTSFALPAMLQLQPVVEAGTSTEWHNSKALQEMMGGKNFVATALRSAGFEYTHVEGGSDSNICYEVDVCVDTGLIDEASWAMLKPTILGPWMVEKYRTWMVPSTLTAFDNLSSLDDVFGDGEPDYVFAHLMLPHAPYVVDARCELIADASSLDAVRLIPGQLECVDRLLLDIGALVSPDTAVVLTGDHGAKSRMQISNRPEDWSAQDIAEAFGVFLAYRLPEGCDGPERNINTHVMRAIVACAVDVELPSSHDDLLIGLHDYRWVTPPEQKEIERGLEAGTITWIEDEVLGVTESGS